MPSTATLHLTLAADSFIDGLLNWRPEIPRARRVEPEKAVREPRVPVDRVAAQRAKRAAFRSQGLNAQGKPRRNTARPQLAGLDRKTYHHEYMRLRRSNRL